MSKLPTTRAFFSMALCGVAALSLLILPGCGEDEGGAGRAASAAMPANWPTLTRGLLAELKKNPACKDAVAGVQDKPEALWQYWRSLVRDLHKAERLAPLINRQVTYVTYDNMGGTELHDKVTVFRVFRRKLEDAIIRHAKLKPEEAKNARQNLFPAVWNSHLHP